MQETSMNTPKAISVPEGSFRKVVPCLRVLSVRDSSAWYKNKLGFEVFSPEDRPDTFASIGRGTKADVNLYLLVATEDFPVQRVEVMIMVEPEAKEHSNEYGGGLAVKALYDDLKDVDDMNIADELEQKPWSFFQFTVLDPDGHRLTFFQHPPDE